MSSELFSYRVGTSIVGKPRPIVLGTNRVSTNAVAIWAWQPTPVSSGGKFGGKGAGGKGGAQQQYTYQMSAILGLCLGPIASVQRIWIDKSLLVVNLGQSTFTVGPPYTFNPTTGPTQTFSQNGGVWTIVPRTITYNDYGSAGSVTETVYDVVAGVEVTGTPTASGTYSVNSTTGLYEFAPADAGLVWQIGYYYVQANPTAAGQIPIGTLAITLFTGEPGQAIWSGVTGNPTPQLGYSELAYFGNLAWQLGTSGTLPNMSCEVSGILQYGSGTGIIDALPSDCINFLLTNFNALFLSSAIVDSSLSATNASPGTASVKAYCLANNIFISPVLDEQRACSDWLREWLLVANSEIISSEGLLKFGCYSEQTAAGYGITYTPATQPIYDLDLDDFIVQSPKDPPIKWTVKAASDVANKMTIEWTDRNNEYNGSTLQEEDAFSVNEYGANPVTSISARSICMQSVAAQVINVRLKRECYQLVECDFTLGWRYCILEPMDVVTVIQQYPGEGRVAVRLLTIDEDENGNLACHAEKLLYGISAPTLHPKQSANTFTPGFQGVPGSVNPPIFFEAPDELTQQVGYELLIALSGGAPNWGGCSVYMSSDGGNTYVYQGKITAKSNMGVTASALPYSLDPDTTDVLDVDLRESGGTLTTTTQADADAFKTLALVDAELIAYEYATLIGSNQYKLASSGGAVYLRRGVFGTVITPHATAAPFTAIDGNQFALDYQSSDIGTIKWFKFTSFNLASQNEEDIANVVPYSYLLKGPRLPYPWAEPTALPNSHNGILTWPRFAVQQGYKTNADTSQAAAIFITGVSPLNAFTIATKPPTFTLATAPTGGSLPGGITLIVAVQALNSTTANESSDLRLQAIFIPAGTNTNTVTVTVTVYDSAHDSVNVYSTQNPDEGWSNQGLIGVGGPYSLTITALGDAADYEPVDDAFVQLVPVANVEEHAGIWGGVISSVASGGGNCTLTINNSTWSTNQLAGRILTLLCKSNMAVQTIIEVPITSNTADTITLPDITAFNHVQAGDVIAIRTLATTYSATTIGDANFINGGAGQAGTGLDPSFEIGNLVLIIAGTGAWQAPRRITGNTTTVLTVGVPFDPVPDATSIFIVLAPNQTFGAPYNPGSVNNFGTQVTFPFELNNSVGQTFFIQVLSQDANGNNSAQWTPAAWREVYQPGGGGFLTLTIASNAVTPDLSLGTLFKVTLNQSTQITINNPIYTGGTLVPGMTLTLWIFQDSTGARPSPAWGTAFPAYNASAPIIAPDASTHSVATLTYHPDGNWYPMVPFAALSS